MSESIQDQPAPIPNKSTPVWELVIEDMRQRDAVGRARYGTPLQAFNGRDALVDQDLRPQFTDEEGQGRCSPPLCADHVYRGEGELTYCWHHRNHRSNADA